MKKVFTLLTAMMLLISINANAQSRKTWDFTKGVSDAARELLDADPTKWDKTATEGEPTSQWTSQYKFEGELTAGDVVIPDLSGLYFSDFAATNAVVINAANKRIRLQKECAVTIKDLAAGQKIAITAQSANSTATDRGFAFTNAATDEGESSVLFLGAEGLKTVVVTVAADGDVKINTSKSGLDVYSIIIDEGDKNIKTWDFTKWSEATTAQVCGAEDWTTSESDSKNYITGNEIRWIAGEAQFDANGDITAGGTAIAEMKGLKHEGVGKYGLAMAFDYQTTTDGNNWGPYTSPAYLWVMTTGSTITVPNVKAGSTLRLGVESHKPGDSRGFEVTVNGATVATLKAATAAMETLECNIPEGEGEYVDVVLKATKGVHLYSIEAEVKDEATVDHNPYLGKPTLSIKNGTRVSIKSEGFTITFPKAKNMEGGTEVTLDGWFGPTENVGSADFAFDGIGGTIGEGITFTYSDFLELEENTSYTFYITRMAVAEPYQKFTEEGEDLYKITFETKGPGINEPRAWQFTNDDEAAAALQASVDAGHGYWNASSKGRFSYASAITEKELMLTPDTKLPITEGLYFTMNNANDILVGTPAGNNGRLQLGGGAPKIHIPSVSAGDEVTVTALWSTKNNSTITLDNGTCVLSEGAEPVTSFDLSGSAVEYKIKVVEDGDLVLSSKNVVYTGISIYPISMGKEVVNYTIVATTPEGETIATIAEGEGETNDKIDVKYSYWLASADGKLYTHGAKGNPFVESVTLTSETVYPIVYKETGIEGVVFCAEAEEIEGTMPVTHANSPIRSSKGTAAYNDADIKLCSLEPGTYKVEAIIFDGNKTPGHTVSFTVGEQQIDLVCTATNFDDVTSDLITVETACDVTWLAGGGENTGLDCVVIYASEDEPDDPEGIENVNADSAAKAVKKIVKDGRLLIETAKGTYTTAGARIK